jgi:hypothetical protein
VSNIEVSAQLDECPLCASAYENIGHPLKPGVIMMRVCKCKITMQTTSNGTITILTSPEEDK